MICKLKLLASLQNFRRSLKVLNGHIANLDVENSCYLVSKLKTEIETEN